MSMTRRFATILALLGLWPGVALSAPADRPNIVLVMPDDVGYGDFSCLGNPIVRTPHVDAFWRQSVRFTDFHVSPTCAPTRAALMTGRHEFKSGVTHTIFERERMSLKAVDARPGPEVGRLRDGHLRQVAPRRRGRLSARPPRVRRGLHPRRRRDRPDLSGQLRRRSRQHLLQPRDPPQRHVREDRGLLHRPVLRPGPPVDRRPAQDRLSVLRLHHAQRRPRAPAMSRGLRDAPRGAGARGRGEVLRHDREHRRQLRPAPGEARCVGPGREHARDLPDRQRRHHRDHDLQRGDAREEGHALPGRDPRAVVLALAGGLPGRRRLRGLDGAHRHLPHARRDRRGLAVGSGEGPGRGPQPPDRS